MDQPVMLDTEAALQPLLQVAKESSKSPDTSRTIILKALSDPSIFCGFDQLKETLEIKDDELLGRTLELFSYGNYQEYREADPGKFLILTDNHLYKLRQLTVLSLVHEASFQASPVISYADLADALDLNNQIDAVEDVLVTCINAGVIAGLLCQKSQRFWISNIMPFRSRDIHRSKTLNLLECLEGFTTRLETTLDQVHQAKLEGQKQKATQVAFWNQHDPNQKVGGSSDRLSLRSRDRPTTRSSNKRSRG